MKRLLLIVLSTAFGFFIFNNGQTAAIHTAAITNALHAQDSPLPTPPARYEPSIANNASFTGPLANARLFILTLWLAI